MFKKVGKIIGIAIFAVACIGLASCDNNNGLNNDSSKDNHTHSFGEWVVVTQATETAEGLKKRTCSECDANETETIAKLAHVHTYSEAEYTYNNDNTKITAKKHCLTKDEPEVTETVNVTATVTKEATCTEKGSITYTSNNFTDSDFEVQTKTVEIDVLGHNYQMTYSWTDDNATCTATKTCLNNPTETYSETVDTQLRLIATPTCTTGGEVSYYATFTTEGFAPQTKRVTTNSLGHHEVTVPGKTPTCSEAGYTDYIYCDECDAVIQERTDLSSVGHNYIRVGAVEATCEHEGATGDLVCEFCSDKLEDSTVIPITEHKIVDDEEVLPTCANSHGLTNGTHCEWCGEVFIAQVEYEDIVPHEIVYTGRMDATCENEGHTEGSYCEICGEVFEESVTIPTTDHSFVDDIEQEPTCTEDGYTMRKICEYCGEIVEGETIPAKGHTPVQEESTHIAHNDIYNDVGTIGRIYCSECNQTITEEGGYMFERYGYDEMVTPTNYGSDVEAVHTMLDRGLRMIRLHFLYATDGNNVNDVAFELEEYTIGVSRNPRASTGYAIESGKTNNSSLSIGDVFKVTITLKDGSKISKTVNTANLTCYFEDVKPSDIASVDLVVALYDYETASYNDLTYTFEVYTTPYVYE